MMESLKDVLMRRDKMSVEEADEAIDEAKKALQEYLANDDLAGAEDVCSQYFGLEPDYVFDLL